MASRFWLADHIVRLFDSHLFISLFQRNKIHFSAANSPFWPAKRATIPDKVMMIDVLSILRRNEKRGGDLEEISRSTALHFCSRQNCQTVAFTEGYDIGEQDIELEKTEVGSIWLLKRWDTSRHGKCLYPSGHILSYRTSRQNKLITFLCRSTTEDFQQNLQDLERKVFLVWYSLKTKNGCKEGENWRKKKTFERRRKSIFISLLKTKSRINFFSNKKKSGEFHLYKEDSFTTSVWFIRSLLLCSFFFGD